MKLDCRDAFMVIVEQTENGKDAATRVHETVKFNEFEAEHQVEEYAEYYDGDAMYTDRWHKDGAVFIKDRFGVTKIFIKPCQVLINEEGS